MLSPSDMGWEVLGSYADSLFIPRIHPFSYAHADALLMGRWKKHRGAGLFAASLSVSLCLWPSRDSVINMRYRCQLCNQCLMLAGWQAALAVQVTVSTCGGLCQYLPPPRRERVSLWQFKDDVHFPDYKDVEVELLLVGFLVMFPATEVDA